MKKLLLGIITVLMIMGMSSNLYAQSDAVSTWKIIGGCLHDSQDEHLNYLDILEPFLLTTNKKTNVIIINDPQRLREYSAKRLIDIQDFSNGVQYYFDAVDEKSVKCKIDVTFYTQKGIDKIFLKVTYSTHILIWEGILTNVQ